MLFRNPDEYRSLKRLLASETTDNLLALWSQANLDESKQAIAHQLLLERGEDIPFLSLKPKYKERKLPVESNASIRAHQSGKIEFRFPRDGFMTHGRFQFENVDDFLHYGAESFGLSSRRPPVSGQASRKGRYQRLDTKGTPIFTFGDPFLDLVTNRHGILVVGEDVYDMKAAMLRSKERRGGVRSCDLTSYADDIFKAQLIHAFTGCKKFVALECGEDGAVLASTNPSDASIKVGNILVKFHAWRTNLGFYWSMGADIETSGGNFKTAQIVGNYFNMFGNTPHCFLVKGDIDADTNDDYVDEWEWGIGPCSSPADGVRSFCSVSVPTGSVPPVTVEAGLCNTFNT